MLSGTVMQMMAGAVKSGISTSKGVGIEWGTQGRLKSERLSKDRMPPAKVTAPGKHCWDGTQSEGVEHKVTWAGCQQCEGFLSLISV